MIDGSKGKEMIKNIEFVGNHQFRKKKWILSCIWISRESKNIGDATRYTGKSNFAGIENHPKLHSFNILTQMWRKTTILLANVVLVTPVHFTTPLEKHTETST
jgi:hypothetical protein